MAIINYNRHLIELAIQGLLSRISKFEFLLVLNLNFRTAIRLRNVRLQYICSNVNSNDIHNQSCQSVLTRYRQKLRNSKIEASVV